MQILMICIKNIKFLRPLTDTNSKFVVLNTNLSTSCYQLVLTIYFNFVHKSAPAKRDVPISYVLHFLPKPFVIKQYQSACFILE